MRRKTIHLLTCIVILVTSWTGAAYAEEFLRIEIKKDAYLLTNAPGRAFVNLYYAYSPSIAEFIRRHEYMRLMTRIVLTPLVYAIIYPWFSLGIIMILTTVLYMNRKKIMHSMLHSLVLAEIV